MGQARKRIACKRQGAHRRHPLRRLGIRSRWIALLVCVIGYWGATHVLQETALASYVAQPASKLDEFAPIYQFSERASIPVRAPASRIYDAIFQVTAAEVPLYRTLVWIRRGGSSGPESVLNPPDDEPLVRRSLSEFLTLSGYSVSSASNGSMPSTFTPSAVTSARCVLL